MDLIPQARDLAEAVLLVVVILVDGPILHVVVFEERFEQPVEVRLGPEPEPRGVDEVHPRDAVLTEVRHRPEVVLLRLVDERFHDVRVVASRA